MASRNSAVKLPASLEAMRQQAQAMFDLIEQRKAACWVHQMANQKADEDIYQVPRGDGEEPRTYAEEMRFLDDSRKALRQSLPPKVLRAIIKARDGTEDVG